MSSGVLNISSLILKDPIVLLVLRFCLAYVKKCFAPRILLGAKVVGFPHGSKPTFEFFGFLSPSYYRGGTLFLSF